MSRVSGWMVVFSVLSMLAGCSAATTRDQIEGLCQARTDSPPACGDPCRTAQNAASVGPCADELAALWDSPDYDAYSSCSGGCPTGRDCAAEGGSGSYGDCECGTNCVGAQSQAFQDIALALFRCLETETTAVCY